MGKEHLNKKENIIPLPHYKGYYIDKVWRKICYKNRQKQWMYCKKVDNRIGYVELFINNIIVEINEQSLMFNILGPSPEKKDGRYKDNADAGIMSKQKVGLILNKERPEPKVYKDTPKDMEKKRRLGKRPPIKRKKK